MQKLGNNPVLPDELNGDVLNQRSTKLTLGASFYTNGRKNLEALELHPKDT